MRKSVGDRERYEVLSRMLRDRQSEIKNRMRSLREVFPAQMAEVIDEEEQRMDEFVRDMDLALVQMEAATLRKINEAIARLEDGHYGICADCEETISEARLKALPFADRCRDCQEAAEAEDGRPAPPARSYDRVEQALSIAAPNERAADGSNAQQLKLYNYAKVLLPKTGGEAEAETAAARPHPVARVVVNKPERPAARPRRPALRESMVARGPRAAKRARA
jgi:DnaK suppressor protein